MNDAAPRTGQKRGLDEQHRRVGDLFAPLLASGTLSGDHVLWTGHPAPDQGYTTTISLTALPGQQVSTRKATRDEVAQTTAGTERVCERVSVVDTSTLDNPKPDLQLRLTFPADPDSSQPSGQAFGRILRGQAGGRPLQLTLVQMRLLDLVLRDLKNPAAGNEQSTLKVVHTDTDRNTGDVHVTRISRAAGQHRLQIVVTTCTSGGLYRQGHQGSLSLSQAQLPGSLNHALQASPSDPDAEHAALHHEMASLLTDIAQRAEPDELHAQIRQEHGSLLVCFHAGVQHRTLNAREQRHDRESREDWKSAGMQDAPTAVPSVGPNEQGELTTPDGVTTLGHELCLALQPLAQAWRTGSGTIFIWTTNALRLKFVPIGPGRIGVSIQFGTLTTNPSLSNTHSSGSTPGGHWMTDLDVPARTALLSPDALLPVLIKVNRASLHRLLSR